MASLGIDIRWKDYLKVQAREDGNIDVGYGNRDIDFDKNGIKTGNGMYMVPIEEVPWEILSN